MYILIIKSIFTSNLNGLITTDFVKSSTGSECSHPVLIYSTYLPPGKEDGGEKDNLSLQGEGGETGELLPGKSLVFAAMELLVFILVRHLPQLNTRVNESPSHLPLRPQPRLPEESTQLVAHTVSILAELPSLCSPAGNTTTPDHTNSECLL
uniref:Uncharacterized protein n=1 Tax=Hucho hucho TaxID=62062 RepID=A0A4W5L7E8_9TELE